MANSRIYTSSRPASYSGIIKRTDGEFKVNANRDGSPSKSGLFNHMLHSGLNQLDIMLAIYCNVLVVRFDLHTTIPTDDNKLIADFLDKLKKNLIRAYGFKHIGYWWVREIEKAITQHYHCALFLDGNKAQTSHKVLEIVRKTWTKIKGNTMPFVEYPYHQIDNSNPYENKEVLEKPNLKCHHNTKAGAIWRISYLAKIRSKSRINPQVKTME